MGNRSERLFGGATPSEYVLVEDSEYREMIGGAGEERVERSSERSSNSQVSRLENALPCNSEKRPHDLISANTSESENPSRDIAAVLQSTSDLIEELHGLPRKDQEAFPETRRRFVKLVSENVSRAEIQYLKGQLHPNFTRERPFNILSPQWPGTSTWHLAFLVRFVNLAVGGFYFFTSACGREVGIDAPAEEVPWQQVIEKQTSGQLRFVFVTDWGRDQSWNINEGLVVAPQGEIDDILFRGTFCSPSSSSLPQQQPSFRPRPTGFETSHN
ncbi:hypothetical protein JCM5350_002607, partial [Sporobolomyces pararoseus]